MHLVKMENGGMLKRHDMRPIIRVVVAMSLLACSSGQLAPPTTGLTGVVTRGPVTPVCRVDLPCSAPFVGTFSVLQGTKVIGTFQSDSEGRFTVMLYPGTYSVVLTDATLLGPFRQSKTVTVVSPGLTTVNLEFDTGIR
jgi:hypothetical protein